MDKDKSQTPIVVTAGQISRAVDRIIARWPKADTDRPDKQALLNDFAASVQPGKNWGSMLASCLTAAQVALAPNDSPARLRKAMADLKALPVSAIAVGTRVIEFALNNVHAIDFTLKRCGFSRHCLHGFVSFAAKPCNFGSAHEAPPAPSGTG